MVCWVAERALAARNVDRVIVATDSQKIIDAVQASGIEAVMTASTHTSGTDRVAEVAATLSYAEIIVNVQGDEPMISPETIERAVDAMAVEISIVSSFRLQGISYASRDPGPNLVLGDSDGVSYPTSRK